MIPVYQPDLNGNEKKYLNECIDSTWISSKGKFIDKFEAEFCKFIDVRYSTTVSNGTVAIHLALKSLGLGEDDEIIVPTFTYIASVNPILDIGAKPIFVESRKNDWQIDPNDIRNKITSKTKAIMVVHLYGQSSPMDEIMQIAKEFNLYVIEDCAEAFGSKYKNKNVGTFGDIATFSFFGNKTITCGEGGMVVSNNSAIMDLAKSLKNQGVSTSKQYWHDRVAYNYRMTNMQAAIGLAQIERAEEFIVKKRQIAQWYKEELAGLPLEFHNEMENTYHTYWMFSILLSDEKKKSLLREYLKENDIDTRPLFYPVDTMDMYSHLKGDFPIANDISNRGMNLPSWPGLTKKDIVFISSIIKKFFSENIE